MAEPTDARDNFNKILKEGRKKCAGYLWTYKNETK